MPGFWKRPVSRTYAYNLEPQWPYNNYQRTPAAEITRSSSVAPFESGLGRTWRAGSATLDEPVSAWSRLGPAGRSGHNATVWAGDDVGSSGGSGGSAFRAARAGSAALGEDRWGLSSSSSSAVRNGASSALVAANEDKWASKASSQKSDLLRSCLSDSRSVSTRSSNKKTVKYQPDDADREVITRSALLTRRVEDDILKKVADAHMVPWNTGAERDAAEIANTQGRIRINDLERELEEITKRCLSTSSRANKTASQLARLAAEEDDAAVAASQKKVTRKVIVESSNKAIA